MNFLKFMNSYMIIKLLVCFIDSEFRVISVSLKVLSPFYLQTSAKTESRKRRTGKNGGTKRERTNKFAANRPLKTRHANGPRGNFKFYDSRSRRCDILRRLPLPVLLFPSRGSYPCGFLPVFPSPFYRRIVFTSPVNVPLKSPRSRKSFSL